MKDLNKYHELILKECCVKDANLLMFMDDHVIRLNKHQSLFDNKCYYDQTKGLLVEFNRLFNHHLVVGLEKVDKTKQVNIIISDFKQAVNKTEGMIRMISGLDSANYSALFPMGLTEMNKMSRKEINGILSRFDVFFTEHRDLYGSTAHKMFKKIRKEYHAARIQQLKFIDQYQLLVVEKRKIKKSLIKNFLRNIYYAYIMNFERPNEISRLFDQSLLTRKVIKAISLNGNGGAKLENWQVH